ncbi:MULTISPECIES: flagellar filament capping protein FliD [Aliiglaciecola]|uniref:flagellar filament capping protein FliD n=1 Tax=Aliiglaciecola TaxID=1406885 RepID=UPI001C098758|nr:MULTISPECIES: flagellar filament capping protein FliD [Aliiglaciecola]MBU2877982.1 flagellar filament capping protein FliD [Aliiglaciecola lipolytica]MDO6709347.1 flagellar filament capping protein FliD [Aliiglaciecola sp. 2_MG-2023]MDO6750495.1 flagellar filament capping protein FliD [Aliiglaciecola sp. 1_MG-2023]
MTIQSLGVGSGLALDDLVTQLIAAERAPKQTRLDDKEEALDAEISGIGQLKSKMSDFLDTVDELRSDNNLQGREPKITNPDDSIEPFTAEAANSAVKGEYQVAITQLASGSRLETADASDGGFASKSDSVLSSGSGSLTFKVDSSGDSFDINVTAGQTLQQLANAINSSDDNFGINASIIDTGTASGGAKLVLTSSTTGEGNDLVIVNNDNLADLDRVSTTDSTEVATYLEPVVSAQNAKATIDGIAVESSTNEFENTISSVSFEASTLSTKDSLGEFQTSTLKIGYDTEGLDKKIRDFVDNFNALAKEIDTLTKYGTSELEDDGVLAGDFMARSITSGLTSIIGSSVESSALGGLFAIGVELNSEGKLEISSYDEFGLGSGEDRLAEALEDNFDDIAALFTDDEDGIAARLYDYTKEYTTFSGLLATRERSAKDEKDLLSDEREQFELRMLGFEEILRDKYLNLDQTVTKLNQTGSALLASLGQA